MHILTRKAHCRSPTRNGANPHPHLEKGQCIAPTRKGPMQILQTAQSISTTRKGPIHIPNRKRSNPYPKMERGLTISLNRRGPAHIPNCKGARPYPQLERGQSISQPERGHQKLWIIMASLSANPGPPLFLTPTQGATPKRQSPLEPELADGHKYLLFIAIACNCMNALYVCVITASWLSSPPTPPPTPTLVMSSLLYPPLLHWQLRCEPP